MFIFIKKRQNGISQFHADNTHYYIIINRYFSLIKI